MKGHPELFGRPPVKLGQRYQCRKNSIPVSGRHRRVKVEAHPKRRNRSAGIIDYKDSHSARPETRGDRPANPADGCGQDDKTNGFFRALLSVGDEFDDGVRCRRQTVSSPLPRLGRLRRTSISQSVRRRAMRQENRELRPKSSQYLDCASHGCEWDNRGRRKLPRRRGIAGGARQRWVAVSERMSVWTTWCPGHRLTNG